MLYTVLSANNYDDSIGMSELFPTKDAATRCMVKQFKEMLTNCGINWDIPDDAMDFDREEDGCIGCFTADGYSLTHDGDYDYARIVSVPGITADAVTESAMLEESCQANADGYYMTINVIAHILAPHSVVSNLTYTFPVTKAEFNYLNSYDEQEIETFLASKIKDAIQSAKYWPEVVQSCYDFNWGDCASSDIVDNALKTISEDAIPAAVRNGNLSHYGCRTIVVNHDTVLLPTCANVRWVGYKNGKIKVERETQLDMTTGDVDDFNMHDDDFSGLDNAAVFFHNGSSVDCDPGICWLKLSESPDAIHVV